MDNATLYRQFHPANTAAPIQISALTPPSARPPILALANILEERLAALNELVAQLDSRISTVLRPAQPDTLTAGHIGNDGCPSTMSDLFDARIREVESIEERVKKLIGRVDL